MLRTEEQRLKIASLAVKYRRGQIQIFKGIKLNASTYQQEIDKIESMGEICYGGRECWQKVNKKHQEQ